MAWEREAGEPEPWDTPSFRFPCTSRNWDLGYHPETNACWSYVACAHHEPLRESYMLLLAVG